MNPTDPFRQLQQGVGEAMRQSRQALQLQQQAQTRAQQTELQNQQLKQQLESQSQQLADLRAALTRLEVSRSAGDPNIQRVENMPGRRIPFDLSVDIPLPANDVQVRSGTITISQEGPFVATCRWACVLSQYQFQVNQENQPPATFQGRSFGRWRPPHSAWDLNDGQVLSVLEFSSGQPAFPGDGSPIMISPQNTASFRSMQADFRVQFENQGSSFPRQNNPVPSAQWTYDINQPWKLGALDVFERGEVLQFRIQQLHPNNPAYGNVFGFLPAPNAAFPFADSQFDNVEGIVDVAIEAADDPVIRAPNAILVLGFSGYRIVQPAGAGYD